MLSLFLKTAFLGSVVYAAPEAFPPGFGPPSGPPSNYTGAPKVTIKNGTVVGMHSTTYNEDVFLGIPYAQAPVNELRFRVPQSLNTTYRSKALP